MTQVKERAVRSAQTVALLRAVGASEKDPAVRSGDYLAKYLLDSKYKWLLRTVPHAWVKRLIHNTAPGTYGSMIIRTRHFDEVLLKEIASGVKQVVILGAGYDTRLYRFADQLSGIPVFELDLPGIQAIKRKRLLEAFRAIPENGVFISLDFNEERFETALQQQQFRPGLKTLFLWEGVSYYLPEAAVRNVFEFVAGCRPGSSILFDYALGSFVQGDQSTYGGKEFAKWLKEIREPFLFGLNAGEAKPFLESCRLRLESDYGAGQLEEMYLRTSGGQLFGRTVGHFRIAHARVA